MIRLLTVILIFSWYLSFAQNVPPQLDSTVKELQKRIAKQDSILKELKTQNQELESKNSILSTTLDTNSSTFDSYSNFIGIFGILVGIVLVGVPIFGYFLVYKPSEAIRSKLEKLETEIPQKVEEQFATYFKNFERDKFKEVIRSLTQSSTYRQALVFLRNTTFRDLDENDQQVIADFLSKNRSIEISEQGILAQLLVLKYSAVTERYFRSVIEDFTEGWKGLFITGIKHLISNNFAGNQRFFENYLIASPSGHDYLMEIFDLCFSNYFVGPFPPGESPVEMRKTGEKVIRFFLNSERIVESTIGKQHIYLDRFIGDSHQMQQYPFITNSYYYQRYFENHKRRDLPLQKKE